MSGCATCRYFEPRPTEIERGLPLLAALSSAHGSSRADDGFCAHHDRYVWARARCVSFTQIAPDPATAWRTAPASHEN